MTPRIMIEERDVAFAGVPSGTVHLYLVYRGADGAEYVLRSGPRSDLPIDTEMEIEANVPIARSEDARGSDTPAERSSTVLSFAGSADTAWAIMVKYARMLDDVDYGYDVFEENSNSFIGALLFAAGGTPSRMLPAGTSASEAFGFSNWGRIDRRRPPSRQRDILRHAGPRQPRRDADPRRDPGGRRQRRRRRRGRIRPRLRRRRPATSSMAGTGTTGSGGTHPRTRSGATPGATG